MNLSIQFYFQVCSVVNQQEISIFFKHTLLDNQECWFKIGHEIKTEMFAVRTVLDSTSSFDNTTVPLERKCH